ncbi:uncharacterized protein EV422DRAFT_478090, partial [Fimicolochytrium jonesii]|uniref:uncharacterized protein n=1 Tax=Fimicolochytrium jonesii TaxID=1396493 RepID=UPI0022FEEFAD
SRTHRKTRHHVTRDLLHNISFHVALFFVLGSIAWIVNGFYVMWPDQMVGDDSKAVDVMNWSAFCGGMLFLIGASLAVVEAGNADHPLPPPRNGGIDVEGGHEVMSMGDATQQQQQQQGKVNPTHNETTKPSDPPTTTRRYKLTWFPRPDPHSLGSLASLIQIFAATVFGISVITGLLTLSHTARMLIFWTPQVIGGLGFIVTSLVYMKEVGFTAVWTLGWQVAVWNLVGAVGFMLCGVFGYWEDAAGGWGWRETASGVNNFYGGWAFLLGSVLQMWEVL